MISNVYGMNWILNECWFYAFILGVIKYLDTLLRWSFIQRPVVCTHTCMNIYFYRVCCWGLWYKILGKLLRFFFNFWIPFFMFVRVFLSSIIIRDWNYFHRAGIARKYESCTREVRMSTCGVLQVIYVYLALPETGPTELDL